LVLGIDGYVRRRKSLDSEKGYTSLKIRFAVEEGVIKELKGKGTKGWGGGGGGGESGLKGNMFRAVRREAMLDRD
jgi:hypothetical protein